VILLVKIINYTSFFNNLYSVTISSI